MVARHKNIRDARHNNNNSPSKTAAAGVVKPSAASSSNNTDSRMNVLSTDEKKLENGVDPAMACFFGNSQTTSSSPVKPESSTSMIKPLSTDRMRAQSISDTSNTSGTITTVDMDMYPSAEISNSFSTDHHDVNGCGGSSVSSLSHYSLLSISKSLSVESMDSGESHYLGLIIEESQSDLEEPKKSKSEQEEKRAETVEQSTPSSASPRKKEVKGDKNKEVFDTLIIRSDFSPSQKDVNVIQLSNQVESTMAFDDGSVLEDKSEEEKTLAKTVAIEKSRKEKPLTIATTIMYNSTAHSPIKVPPQSPLKDRAIKARLARARSRGSPIPPSPKQRAGNTQPVVAEKSVDKFESAADSVKSAPSTPKTVEAAILERTPASLHDSQRTCRASNVGQHKSLARVENRSHIEKHQASPTHDEADNDPQNSHLISMKSQRERYMNMKTAAEEKGSPQSMEISSQRVKRMQTLMAKKSQHSSSPNLKRMATMKSQYSSSSPNLKKVASVNNMYVSPSSLCSSDNAEQISPTPRHTNQGNHMNMSSPDTPSTSIVDTPPTFDDNQVNLEVLTPIDNTVMDLDVYMEMLQDFGLGEEEDDEEEKQQLATIDTLSTTDLMGSIDELVIHASTSEETTDEIGSQFDPASIFGECKDVQPDIVQKSSSIESSLPAADSGFSSWDSSCLSPTIQPDDTQSISFLSLNTDHMLKHSTLQPVVAANTTATTSSATISSESMDAESLESWWQSKYASTLPSHINSIVQEAFTKFETSSPTSDDYEQDILLATIPETTSSLEIAETISEEQEVISTSETFHTSRSTETDDIFSGVSLSSSKSQDSSDVHVVEQTNSQNSDHFVELSCNHTVESSSTLGPSLASTEYSCSSAEECSVSEYGSSIDSGSTLQEDGGIRHTLYALHNGLKSIQEEVSEMAVPIAIKKMTDKAEKDKLARETKRRELSIRNMSTAARHFKDIEDADELGSLVSAEGQEMEYNHVPQDEPSSHDILLDLQTSESVPPRNNSIKDIIASTIIKNEKKITRAPSPLRRISEISDELVDQKVSVIRSAKAKEEYELVMDGQSIGSLDDTTISSPDKIDSDITLVTRNDNNTTIIQATLVDTQSVFSDGVSVTLEQSTKLINDQKPPNVLARMGRKSIDTIEALMINQENKKHSQLERRMDQMTEALNNMNMNQQNHLRSDSQQDASASDNDMSVITDNKTSATDNEQAIEEDIFMSYSESTCDKSETLGTRGGVTTIQTNSSRSYNESDDDNCSDTIGHATTQENQSLASCSSESGSIQMAYSESTCESESETDQRNLESISDDCDSVGVPSSVFMGDNTTLHDNSALQADSGSYSDSDEDGSDKYNNNFAGEAIRNFVCAMADRVGGVDNTAKDQEILSVMSTEGVSISLEQSNLSMLLTRLRKEGIEVLKLNRENKWQPRFLTVTKEAIDSGNESLFDVCPRGLLWLKKFDPSKAYTEVSITGKNRKGGILLTEVSRISIRTHNEHPLSKKQMKGKFKNSITFVLHTNGLKGDILFRCLDKNDAFALSAGLQQCFQELLHNEKKHLSAQNFGGEPFML